MLTPEQKLLKSGDISYYAGGYSALSAAAQAALTSSNHVAQLGVLDALSFTSVGHIKNVAVNHTLENESITRAGNCGVGEIDRSVEKLATLTWDWLDLGNIDALAEFLELDVTNVAASPVTVTNEIILASGSNTAGQQYTLQHYDGDGTLVGSIVVQNNASALVLNTDYTITLVGDRTVITFITVNAATGIGLNVDYSYTPNVKKLTGYNHEKTTIPYNVMKFVSCVIPYSSSEGMQYTTYFVKYVLNAAVVQSYIDRTEQDFTGSPMSMQSAIGGYLLESKAVVAL